MQSFPDICIEPITSQHWPAFNQVRLFPEQKEYICSARETQKQFIFNRSNGAPLFELYVIKLERELVGFFSLTMEKDSLLWFGSFQIDKKYQKKGIGKAVFSKLFKLVINNPSYQGVSLNVQCQNKHAVNFYLKLGFDIVQQIEAEQVPLWLMTISRDKIRQKTFN